MDISLTKLKEKLNIDLLGVTDASPLDDGDIKKSMELGIISQFQKGTLEQMVDPKLTMADAKTIFVVGLSYYWDLDHPHKYKVSRYTRGVDYHSVLRAKLEDLKDELLKHYDFKYHIQVDIGNLSEKGLAQRANLGTIGKNSLLINEEFGTFLFLGLLLTDMKVGINNKESKDMCKECTICVDSCPTSALLGDGLLDTNKCLSAISQSREDSMYKDKMTMIVGCDICQLVCPYNKEIPARIHSEFEPRIYGLDRDYIESISNNQFRREYKDYALGWLNRKVILRNMDWVDQNVCRNTRDQDKNK